MAGKALDEHDGLVTGLGHHGLELCRFCACRQCEQVRAATGCAIARPKSDDGDTSAEKASNGVAPGTFQVYGCRGVIDPMHWRELTQPIDMPVRPPVAS